LSIASSSIVEAEDFTPRSPFEFYEVLEDQNRTIVMRRAASNINGAPGTVGDLFYPLVANQSKMSLYMTVDSPKLWSSTFYYKLDGYEDQWRTSEKIRTIGYQEVKLATWTDLVPGEAFTFKMERDKSGPKFDRLRLVGGGFVTRTPALREPSPASVGNEDTFVLTPYQLASALAFLFTESGPDTQLLSAARRGALTSKAQVSRHIELLLKSDRVWSRLGFESHLHNGVAAPKKDDNDYSHEIKLAIHREVESLLLDDENESYKCTRERAQSALKSVDLSPADMFVDIGMHEFIRYRKTH